MKGVPLDKKGHLLMPIPSKVKSRRYDIINNASVYLCDDELQKTMECYKAFIKTGMTVRPQLAMTGMMNTGLLDMAWKELKKQDIRGDYMKLCHMTIMKHKRWSATLEFDVLKERKKRK